MEWNGGGVVFVPLSKVIVRQPGVLTFTSPRRLLSADVAHIYTRCQHTAIHSLISPHMANLFREKWS